MDTGIDSAVAPADVLARHRGQMAERMRAHDWAASPLGPPASWSPALNTLVELMLASQQPMFMAWGAQQTWLYNDAFIPILGRKHPDALGRPAMEVWAEARADLAPLFARVRAGEAVQMDDFALQLDRRGQLEEAHFAFSYTPAREADGAVAGLFGACIETTDKVLAERQRGSEELRQRRMFEQAPGFIAILEGPDHVFTFTNAAYSRLIGGREVIGRTVREALPEVEAQGFPALLDRVYRTGQRHVADQAPVRLQPSPDQPAEFRYLDFIYEPITDAAGQVSGIFVEGHDVTAVYAAQEELRRNERRQALLVELGDRLRELDEPADISYAAAELLGQALGVSRAGYGTVDPRDETIVIERDWNAPGIRSLAGKLHFRDYGSYIEDLKRGETAVVEDAELDPRTRDTADALKAISAQAFVNMPVTEQAGMVALLYLNHEVARPWTPEELAFIREVAERTRMAVERRRAEKDLVALTASLEQQVAERTRALMQTEEALRQSQKLEAMGQLTGGVAHDFNNLLTPIVGGLDMLQRRGLGGAREQRLIEGALQSAERAKTLVQRLLAFSRRQPLQAAAVDVAGLVRGMSELVASTSGPQIRVAVDVAEELPPAAADPNQLEMAILNLSVNARDAMPDGGTLRISAVAREAQPDNRLGLKPGPYVCLSVADTGVGMDEVVLARAVEPFFSTKGVGKGTGLGLSMAHGLAAQLGGTLDLSSRPGLGTNVELWLPVSDASPETAERPAPATAPGVEVGVALLVDDEELARSSTADMLKDLGYAVVEARSGEQGLALLREGLEPQVLVTDHLMPGLSGVDLVREALALRPQLRVLVISGFAEKEGIAPDLPRLAKPFRQAELAAMLAEISAAR